MSKIYTEYNQLLYKVKRASSSYTAGTLGEWKTNAVHCSTEFENVYCLSDVIRVSDRSACTLLRAQHIRANDSPPTTSPRQRRLSAGFCIFRLIFTACHRIGRHKVYFLVFLLKSALQQQTGNVENILLTVRCSRVCVCVCRCESTGHQLMVQHLHHLRAIFPKTSTPMARHRSGSRLPSWERSVAVLSYHCRPPSVARRRRKILRGSTSRVSKV